MAFRSLLLAGTVLPIGFLCSPAALAERDVRLSDLILAQVEVPCPEGQECPLPADDGTQGGEVTEPPAPDANAPPTEEPPPPELPAEEQPPPDQPAAEPPPPLEEPSPPAAEEPPPPAAEEPPQPAAGEPPAPVEEPPPVVEEPPPPPPEPAPPAEDPTPPTDQPAAESPPAGEPPPPAPESEPAPPADQDAPLQELETPDAGAQPPLDQPNPVEAVVPEPGQANTVDEQLEAQGDEEEANRVRGLRERMLDQFEQIIQPDTGADRSPDGGVQNWYEDDDVLEQRGNNIIIDLGNGQIYVQPVVPDDANRLLYGADNVEVQELRGGRTRTIVYRRNGTQIITLRDRHGEIIRRTRVLPDGTEIILIDNRFDDDDFDRPPRILLNVPPPRIVIPQDQYIVDLGRANYDEIRGALLAPPVAEPERRYTLDEVLRNEPVRAYSPRIDLDTITFDFGSATIGRDQMPSLVDLGQALEDVIREHPDEVYLIEGHTDAVGSEYDNLILSDRRAESVAVALSQNFDIPPENLITQGYGEQYLKVDTDDPERRNRRATVRRVTELLQAQN